MIEPLSFDVLAEIAIALVGFTGVVAALSRTILDRRRLRLRLVLLFVNGTTALWGSLAPTVAVAIGMAVEQSDIYVLAGTLYVPALLAVNIYAWVQFGSLIRRKQTPARAFYIVTPLVMASLGYLLIALFWHQEHVVTAHYVSIVFMLFLGLYHFFVLTTAVLTDVQSDA